MDKRDTDVGEKGENWQFNNRCFFFFFMQATVHFFKLSVTNRTLICYIQKLLIIYGIVYIKYFYFTYSIYR